MGRQSQWLWERRQKWWYYNTARTCIKSTLPLTAELTSRPLYCSPTSKKSLNNNQRIIRNGKDSCRWCAENFLLTWSNHFPYPWTAVPQSNRMLRYGDLISGQCWRRRLMADLHNGCGCCYLLHNKHFAPASTETSSSSEKRGYTLSNPVTTTIRRSVGRWWVKVRFQFICRFNSAFKVCWFPMIIWCKIIWKTG